MDSANSELPTEILESASVGEPLESDVVAMLGGRIEEGPVPEECTDLTPEECVKFMGKMGLRALIGR